MQRKPNPSALTAAFLVLSALLSVATLSTRNLYDDELSSLYLVTAPVPTILAISTEGDVHPPGMYLLAHLAWRAVHSFRWMNLLPALVFYSGLAVFLLQIVPLVASTRARLCLLLLATLHPELLLWSATYRWYSWWTGLALITLTLALQPRATRPTLTLPRAAALGLLFTGLFYLNYITLLFLLALAPAVLLRYRTQPRRSLLINCSVSLIFFLALIAPQLHTMIAIHLPGGAAQRYGPAFSTLRLLQALAASEAYLPWHPLAILATLLFAALAAIAVRAISRLNCNTAGDSPLAPTLLFAALFLVLVAASGLGGKPRNGLLLIPTLAPAAALLFESSLLRSRTRAQTAILLLLALWSPGGIVHILTRSGLSKSTMNDRPEEVVAFVRSNLATAASPAPACSVVVTYDQSLAFELAQAGLPRTLVISPYRGPYFGGTRAMPPADCAQPRLYLVQSYLGGAPNRTQAFRDELQIAQKYVDGPPATHSFSPDPDAPAKRRLARLPGLHAEADSLTRLPDERYLVTSGLTTRTSLAPMRRRMTHFVSGYEIGPAQNMPAPDEPATPLIGPSESR